MGKRIIVQARGKGSLTYRVRKKAYIYKMKIPKDIEKEEEEAVVIKLINSMAHGYPVAKIKYSKGIFYIPAFKGMVEEQKIKLNTKEIKIGNIVKLGDVPIKTSVYNIESRPFDGGKFIRSSGNSAVINRIVGENILVLMPSKKEKKFNKNCRVVIGEIAGQGRLDKPFLKAGKKHHLVKSRNKLWPRTSAVKMNAIDHPFGSGRGKNPKPKIAKRNSPPGARVGLIRPRRTGKRKK
jgi:large subunit ribosomal protein L2